MRQLRLYLVQIAVFLRPDVSDSYIIGHHRHNEIWKQNEKMQRSVNYFLLKVWNFWLKALKRVNRYLLGIRMIINGMVSCAECIYLKQIFLFSMKNKRSLLKVVSSKSLKLLVFVNSLLVMQPLVLMDHIMIRIRFNYLWLYVFG